MQHSALLQILDGFISYREEERLKLSHRGEMANLSVSALSAHIPNLNFQTSIAQLECCVIQSTYPLVATESERMNEDAQSCVEGGGASCTGPPQKVYEHRSS